MARQAYFLSSCREPQIPTQFIMRCTFSIRKCNLNFIFTWFSWPQNSDTARPHFLLHDFYGKIWYIDITTMISYRENFLIKVAMVCSCKNILIFLGWALSKVQLSTKSKVDMTVMQPCMIFFLLTMPKIETKIWKRKSQEVSARYNCYFLREKIEWANRYRVILCEISHLLAWPSSICL